MKTAKTKSSIYEHAIICKAFEVTKQSKGNQAYELF